jgi:hypothetical protein
MNIKSIKVSKIGRSAFFVIAISFGVYGLLAVFDLPQSSSVVHAGDVSLPAVAGFVRDDGSTFGSGFKVVKISNGRYHLFFPTTTFSGHPAVAVSGWGIPGQAPTVNVAFNDFNNGSFRAEVWVFAADGVTPINAGFQFVAVQTQ